MEVNDAVRGRQAGFVTSAGGLAVYPLWLGGVSDALAKFISARANLTRKLGVAAVLPDQLLDVKEMDDLEEAGLLVVEVPQGAQQLEVEAVARLVENEIDGQTDFTAGSPFASSSIAGQAPDFIGEDGQVAEDELLQEINDVEAGEGSV